MHGSGVEWSGTGPFYTVPFQLQPTFRGLSGLEFLACVPEPEAVRNQSLPTRLINSSKLILVQLPALNKRLSIHDNPPSPSNRSHESINMGDVMVENPANQVLPHRKQLPSSIPNIDSLEGLGTDGTDEYSTLKKLERHME